MTIQEDAYSDGVRTARQAIADGVPRWIHTSDRAFGQMIDPDTGLPVAHMSARAELTDWQTSYAQGFNDAISAALNSGEVTVDFRPLFMTRPEVVRALAEQRLGTLSTENPSLAAPSGDFVLELRLPKPTAKLMPIWIRYSRQSGEEWPKFAIYDGPLDVAIGRNGRVLVFGTPCLFLTRDVVTTQVLNSYPV